MLGLVAVPFAAAQSSPTDDLAGWRWSAFGEQEGLPSNIVYCLADAGDQEVWIGTSHGVAWFDGWDWHVIEEESGLPAQAVHGLCADPAGTIWVAFARDLYRGNRAGFHRVDALDALGVDRIDSLALDEDGTAIILGGVDIDPGALVRIGAEGVEALEAPTLSGAPPQEISLVQSRSGKLWVRTREGVFFREGGEWKLFLETPWPAPAKLALDENEQGTGVLGMEGFAPDLRTWEWSAHASPAPVRSLEGGVLDHVSLAPDGEVFAVFDTREVLVRRDGRWKPIEFFSQDFAGIQFARYRGNGDLWVGTKLGLWLVHRTSRRWTRWVHDERFDGRNRVNGLAFDSAGRVLLATSGGLERRALDGSILHDAAVETAPRRDFTGLGVGPGDDIWLSHGGDLVGLLHWDGEEWTSVREDAAGKTIGLVHAIEADLTGGLWFLSLARGLERRREETGEVHRFVNGRIERWAPADVLGGARMYDFEETPDGARWFAHSRGISRLRDGAWTTWDMDDGLRGRYTKVLCADGEGGMWFGQEEGLGNIDPHGRVTYVDLGGRRELNSVWGLVRGEDGDLWVTSRSGLHCVRDGFVSTFEELSGLSNPRLWPLLLRDEKLYVGALGGGVYVLDMHERREPPPRVRLEEPMLVGDRVAVRWRPLTWWGSVDPGRIDTRIRIDKGPWSPWGPRTERVFEGLGSGRHSFEVQAKGLFARVGRDSALASITIPPARWQDPKVVGPIGVLLVVTITLGTVLFVRRRRHIEMLRRSEAEHRLLMEEASDAIFLCDADGNCLRANGRAVELTGRSADSLAGQPILDLFAPRDADSAALLARLDSGQTVVAEFRIAAAKAEERIVEISAKRLADGRIQLIARDLTERRRFEADRRALERELIDVQKHESVGALAGGVAHDFNNLLTVILGNADQALASPSLDAPARERLEQLISTTRRAGELTQQLLVFAGRDSIQCRPLDLNELIWEMEGLLRASIRRGVELDTRLEHDLPTVEADATRLRQVVLNLVVNASDAIGEGVGKIRLRTRRQCGDDRVVGEEDEAIFEEDQLLVVLEVADDGHGMDEETQARIFDPFFSTKTSGHGLGLPTVCGIVRRHGGSIRVQSEPGKGSRFTVLLPASPKPIDVVDQTETPDYVGKGETLLVIDDEVAVCDVTAAMLDRLGFRALRAYGGEEGIRLFEAHRDEVAGVIVDLTMPRCDGMQTRDAILRLEPDTPIVLMSGFRAEKGEDSPLEDGGEVFLQKPFSPVELQGVLRAAFRDGDLVLPSPRVPEAESKSVPFRT